MRQWLVHTKMAELAIAHLHLHKVVGASHDLAGVADGRELGEEPVPAAGLGLLQSLILQGRAHAFDLIVGFTGTGGASGH